MKASDCRWSRTPAPRVNRALSAPRARGTLKEMSASIKEIAKNANEAAKVAKESQKGKGRKVTDPPERFVVAIEDNGPGVPDAIRDRIFYPLVSGREGGTGLGLTISSNLVQMMGGQIWVESELGEGTAVRFVLPVGANGG